MIKKIIAVITLVTVLACMFTFNISANTLEYKDFTLENGYLRWLKTSKGENFYALKDTEVVIKAHIDTREDTDNIRFGYYDCDTEKFTGVKPKRITSATDFLYKTTITIPKSGYYRFYITNKKASEKTLEFKEVSVSY
jgi:hypothetical protein